ncbi:MAG TPA: copper transporter [Actinomycetota bacterium]
MISWRYHVVSIVAVILAFGLGILAGTSVVGDRFARDLQLNYDEAIGERDAALDMVALQQRFADALGPTLRDGVLTGEEAVVVTVAGVDGPAQIAVDELTAAGADVLATLTIDRRLTDVPDEETVSAIEEILGVTGTDPDSLEARIADALAVRLAVGPDGDTDLLGALLAAGLITADRDLDEDALLGIGGAGQLVVVAAGGRSLPDRITPQTLLVPFFQRLVQLGTPTSGVGPTDDLFGLVSAIREAPGIADCASVTVDDLDLEGIGGITMIMGIEQFLVDDDPAFRPGGDYGFGSDAMMVVPGADEPPPSCRA